MNDHQSFGAVTPSDFARIREIFEAALQQAPHERAMFVEKACGGNALVAGEVRRMLAGHVDSNWLLDGGMPGGTRIRSGATFSGHFQIGEILGRGGMGEVYRGRDSNLNRDVAVKILPDSFGADVDRLGRFRREAQVVASLSHPNIAVIYGFEESEGIQALILELVEGPTLQDRIAQGPIPVEEAVPIARQIAEALEAAHEHGVIHRDLKPANVKLRPDGVVKVLDFGLAKALEPAEPTRGSKTALPAPVVTGIGTVLGTPAYMAPEQAKGNAVDRRADIWAFGVLLYEMLSGRRAIRGDGVAETLASVLSQEIDWTALPSSTPAVLRTLISRCLDRDVRRRLRDIGEARILLEDPSERGTVDASWDPGLVRRKPRWRTAMPIVIAVLLTSALAGVALRYLQPSQRNPVGRFSFFLPEGQAPAAGSGGHVLTVSPDGTQIVYAALPAARLYLRSMSQMEVTPIRGTEGHHRPTDPVFSPDGQWLAFYALADQTIKRIPVTGGVALTICPADNPMGMSWGVDGIIVGQDRGIMRVSPEGGKPEWIVRLKDGEVAHGPQVLPGGKHVLFSLSSGDALDRWDKASVVVQSLSSAERKTLFSGGSEARYVPTGHIVYTVGQRLYAVLFDSARLEVKGSPALLVENVRRALETGAAQYSFSATGSLIYLPRSGSQFGEQQLALIDRKGEVEKLQLPPGPYLMPRVSPNGMHIAFEMNDGHEEVVWTYDLSGTTAMRRLTFGSKNRFPVWSADSKRIAFQSDRDNDLGIFWQSVDGAGTAERLTRPELGTSHVPHSWSPSGETLLYDMIKNSDISLWKFSLKDRSVTPFDAVHSATPTGAVFSPDGRWVAYSTGQKGKTTVYVQPFPASGAKYQLVTSGNAHGVVWSTDGRELFYNPRPRGFEAVQVHTTPTFTFGRPESVARPFAAGPPERRRSYDMTPSGRFLGLTREGLSETPQIHVILNWFDELGARASARR